MLPGLSSSMLGMPKALPPNMSAAERAFPGGAICIGHKINHKLGRAISGWYLNAYEWHKKTQDDMLSHSRIFLAYDGALGEHGHGRDTSEFCEYVVDRMGESMLYFTGRIAPRVEMEIALDDPGRFPYQYVKWVTRIKWFNFIRHINNHYTWISFSVLLILIQVLTLLIILK